MTDDELPKTWRKRLRETAQLIGALSIIASAALGIWAWLWGPIDDFFDRLKAMEGTITQLVENQRSIMGEDRVIRETPGLTYVAEPVHEGDRVTFHYVAARTRLGESCILRTITPLFIDERNTPTPGPSIPAARQITRVPVQMALSFQMPPDLRPGRIVMNLIFEFRCDGEPFFDQTSTAAFHLLERTE